MGSAHGGKTDERTTHNVTISRPFCMGAYEITVEEWDAVMGDGRPPEVRREQLMPKVSVTWEEAQQFVERLNERYPDRHFFLPTEAQWEYAARAGSAARYSFGDDASNLYLYANCRGKEGHLGGYNGLAPIGKFRPNQWQLYDMQGNVEEWVADFYGIYDEASSVDPTGPAMGDRRVYRGGSFMSAPDSCSVTHRASLTPDTRRKNLGFRIAADPVR